MDSIEYYTKIARQYPPLSIEQEKKLIAENRGDEARCRELLVYHNIAAAISVGAKYRGRIDDRDEGVQMCVKALVESAKRFDLDSKYKFITYAMTAIMHATSPKTEKQGRDEALTCSGDELLNTKISSKEDDVYTIFDSVDGSVLPGFPNEASDPHRFDREYMENEECAMLMEVIDTAPMSQKRKDMVSRKFLLAKGAEATGKSGLMSEVEIANTFGMTKQAANLNMKKSLRLLRERLKRRDCRNEACIGWRMDRWMGSRRFFSGGGTYKRIFDERMVECRRSPRKPKGELLHFCFFGNARTFYSNEYWLANHVRRNDAASASSAIENDVAEVAM